MLKSKLMTQANTINGNWYGPSFALPRLTLSLTESRFLAVEQQNKIVDDSTLDYKQ